MKYFTQEPLKPKKQTSTAGIISRKVKLTFHIGAVA
jgi:hypothetical protein